MSHTNYISSTDDGLATQMITFKNNIPGELAALGLFCLLYTSPSPRD